MIDKAAKGAFTGIDSESMVDELGRRMSLSNVEFRKFKRAVLMKCGYREEAKYVRPEEDDEDDEHGRFAFRSSQRDHDDGLGR